MSFKLWRFKGGLPLLAKGKKTASSLAIQTAPTPEELIYPLTQHIGQAAVATVKVGDRVLRGQLIAKAEGFVSAPIHAASSGVVSGIAERQIPHPSGLKGLCICIKTDGLDEELPASPIADFRTLEAAEIVNIVREAGLVGLGGAAFPTAVKLGIKSDAQIKMLIINAAECEPYISCDDRLLKERAEKIIQGVEILLYLLKPEQAVIALEDHAAETYQVIKAALDKNANSAIQAVQIPTIYPTGSEKQLIKTLTGQEVPQGKIPADIGLVSLNVGTTYAVQQAVVEGKPLTSRITTVTGEGIKTPRNLEVRIGTPMSKLVAFCDGYTENAERIIMGGPMMGVALTDDAIPVVKATNCLLVPTKKEVVLEKQAMPCIRCGQCASVCPVSLLPQQMYWYSRSDQLDKAESYNVFDCIECGSCDVVCPSHIPLVQHFRYAKTAIKARKAEKQQSSHARDRFEAREERLAKEKAERAERSRLKRERLKNKAAKAEIAGSVERSNEKRQAKEPAEPLKPVAKEP